MISKRIEEKSKLGKILLNRRYISERELMDALAYQALHNLRLGEALVALNFISTKQLNRALKRQGWIRGFAAGVALLMTPFTPALAAGSSGLGQTSSASSQISLTILPKSQAQTDGKVTFKGQNDDAIADGFCFEQSGIKNFRLSIAQSNNLSRQFPSVNDINPSPDFNVAYRQDKQPFVSLSRQPSTQVFSVGANSSLCEKAFKNQLKISQSLFESDKNRRAITGNVVTLTVAAE